MAAPHFNGFAVILKEGSTIGEDTLQQSESAGCLVPHHEVFLRQRRQDVLDFAGRSARCFGRTESRPLFHAWNLRWRPVSFLYAGHEKRPEEPFPRAQWSIEY